MGTRSYSRQPLPLHDDLADEAAGGELPAMTESFHSEHRRGASLVGQRGRGLDRPEGEIDHVEERRKRVSQTSGRGASIVFLAVFGMWGVGFGGGQSAGSMGLVERVGRVLPQPTAYIQNTVHPSVYFASSPKGVVQLQYIPLDSSVLPQTSNDAEPAPPPDETDRTSYTWIIGRISAWTCTTMYLTSRMPQIWKNVSWTIDVFAVGVCLSEQQPYCILCVLRLSPSLTGHYTYSSLNYSTPVNQSTACPSRSLSLPSLGTFSMSPRSSRPRECLAHLPIACDTSKTASRKSPPSLTIFEHFLTTKSYTSRYLIGSSGTFVFDFTIVIQSFVYRGLRPVTSATVGQPRRRYTAAVHGTEQDALLGRSRSRSIGWARRSPSVSRGRASLERYGKRTRPSIDHPGYGSTQGAVPGQGGGA